MQLFGLLGKTLSHSFSKKYFTEKFEKLGLVNHYFELFEIPAIEQFPDLVASKKPHLRGMNVTIPYKEQVMPYLHSLDDSAAQVGAVNVIKVMPDGTLKGYNSDFYGFLQSLKNTLETHRITVPDKALILGTGGASKAVKAALNELGIKTYFVSRDSAKADFTYLQLNDINLNEYLLIVNTSPLGTYPNVEERPDIPYHKLTNKHLLFDLVYNPLETSFMKMGAKYGAYTQNGLEMLYLQAEKAWDIWNS